MIRYAMSVCSCSGQPHSLCLTLLRWFNESGAFSVCQWGWEKVGVTSYHLKWRSFKGIIAAWNLDSYIFPLEN